MCVCARVCVCVVSTRWLLLFGDFKHPISNGQIPPKHKRKGGLAMLDYIASYPEKGCGAITLYIILQI